MNLLFGANTPSTYRHNFFTANRNKIYQKVSTKDHFHEDEIAGCVKMLLDWSLTGNDTSPNKTLMAQLNGRFDNGGGSE